MEEETSATPDPGRLSCVYIRKTCPGADGAHLVKVAPGVALPAQWGGEWNHVPEERLVSPTTIRCTVCQFRITITRESTPGVSL